MNKKLKMFLRTEEMANMSKHRIFRMKMSDFFFN